MRGTRLTRRQALVFGGLVFAGIGSSGCEEKKAAVKAVAEVAKQVVKKLPWVGQVISAVVAIVDLADRLLTVRAQVNGKEELRTFKLTPAEVEILRNGGPVTIQSDDGKEMDSKLTTK